MTPREELEAATRRLEDLARRISDAVGRPATEVEALARQAADLSAAVVDIIPRAIAEAESVSRADVPRIGDPAGSSPRPAGRSEDTPAGML